MDAEKGSCSRIGLVATGTFIRYSHDRKDQAFPLPHQMSMQHFKEGMGKFAAGLIYIEAGIAIERESWAINAELQAEANQFMDGWV